MGWFQGAGAHRMKWLVLAAGLLTTSCAGVIGAGAAVVVIGAGVLTFTCYDRVAVTVTDRVTGTKLCDAKVTFIKGKSETVATSCYQAALSSGSYTLRVERPGLETFEEPVDVSESGQCGQTIQTMYVALDRRGGTQLPDQGPPPAAPVTVLPPGAPPSPSPPPAATPPATTPPAAPGQPAAPPSAPAPAATVPPPAAPPSAAPPSAAPPPAAPAPAKAPPAPAGGSAPPAPSAKPGASAFPDAP